jgi:hypothetical protein
MNKSPRKTKDGDSDSDGPRNLNDAVKDNNTMPRQLKDWLNS